MNAMKILQPATAAGKNTDNHQNQQSGPEKECFLVTGDD